MTDKLQTIPVVIVWPSPNDCFDRRLLIITDGSRVYLPRPHRSFAAVFVAMMLLLGDVEINPGRIASKLNFGLLMSVEETTLELSIKA